MKNIKELMGQRDLTSYEVKLFDSVRAEAARWVTALARDCDMAVEASSPEEKDMIEKKYAFLIAWICNFFELDKK